MKEIEGMRDLFKQAGLEETINKIEMDLNSPFIHSELEPEEEELQ